MSAIYPEYLVLVLGVVIDARYTGALPISTRYLPTACTYMMYV